MFNQYDFGKRLKMFRQKTELTQRETALKIGVSEQAISKWENGVCLPDVCNLKLLANVLRISVDTLLDVENEQSEKVVETIKLGGAIFEVVEKPRTILAGKILYAKDYADVNDFYSAIDSVPEDEKQAVCALLADCVLPIYDIRLSVNFWRAEDTRAYGFVREVRTENQPEGADVYTMPPSLYLRAYTDSAAAQLISKKECETWELFSYMRQYVMPANKLRTAENGAQELEIFDTSEHKNGFAYIPVSRI